MSVRALLISLLLSPVLCACASHVAPTHGALALPAHPPTVANAPRALPIEPGVGEPDACEVQGLSLPVETPIDLCGAPDKACFGRLMDSYGVGVQRLAVSPSLAAHLVYERSGVVVSAVIDGREIHPHFAKPRLVADFFVPTFATLSITDASASHAGITVAPGEDVGPAVPMTARVACSDLTNDDVSVSIEDVEAVAHLGRPIEKATIHPRGAVALRTTPQGPIVARVDADDHEANVYRRAAHRALVLLQANEGYLVGWVDESVVTGAVIGFHRIKAPSLRMGITQRGFVCPHDVPVLVEVAGDEVHAATIKAGTAFDPRDAVAVLTIAGVQLLNGATARVRDADVADCTAP